MAPEPHLFLLLPFPDIDPVAIRIGPLAIRWYSLAYLAGFLLGWRYVHYLNRRPPRVMETVQIDDLLFWMMLGVVLGGRLGYVLFYNFAFYVHEPLQALAIWRGGMSFHGGLIGVALAAWLFSRRKRLPFLAIGDLVVAAMPIGLLLGRIANFINGELYGRASDLPWAMVFPSGGPEPRHPSQLYEAALEGVAAFVLLFLLAHLTRIRERPGLLSGIFLVWYAVARFLVEFVREPDTHLGLIVAGATMGQLLSLPVLAFGLWLIWRACAAERYAGEAPRPKP